MSDGNVTPIRGNEALALTGAQTAELYQVYSRSCPGLLVTTAQLSGEQIAHTLQSGEALGIARRATPDEFSAWATHMGVPVGRKPQKRTDNSAALAASARFTHEARQIEALGMVVTPWELVPAARQAEIVSQEAERLSIVGPLLTKGGE